MEITDETTKEHLQTKNPKIPSFYLLPKIHKPNNPGRPIVNSIGSVTEKISSKKIHTYNTKLCQEHCPFHQHYQYPFRTR